MADTTATKQKLRRYIEEVGRRAFEQQIERDTAAVPRGTSEHTDGSARLADTRQVSRTATGGAITYPTDIANFLQDGTQAHPIRVRVAGALFFLWDSGPPDLASPRGSNRYFFKQVMHPGSTIHVGWFTDQHNERTWSGSVRDAASQVQF